MPRARSSMHLDTVMTMVDHEAFAVYPEVRGRLRAHTLRPRPGGPACTSDGDVFEQFAAALGIGSVEVIETGGGAALRSYISGRLTVVAAEDVAARMRPL